MNKVIISGMDTSKLPNLSGNDLENMLRRIKNGENDLRPEFVKCNLRLVLSVIQRFSRRSEEVDDLIQVGCIGLLKAIDNFDFKYQVKFSTYAVPMIIGEMRRYLRDNHPLRVSRSLRDLAYKALAAKNDLVIKLDREPTIDEIAAAIEVPSENVAFAMDAIQDPVSMFEPVYNESGDSIFVMDQISDKSMDNEKWVEDLSLRQGMDKLNPREKMILYMRFFKGKTQVEVANEIGISEAQVLRLEKKALKNMRRHIE